MKTDLIQKNLARAKKLRAKKKTKTTPATTAAPKRTRKASGYTPTAPKGRTAAGTQKPSSPRKASGFTPAAPKGRKVESRGKDTAKTGAKKAGSTVASPAKRQTIKEMVDEIKGMTQRSKERQGVTKSTTQKASAKAKTKSKALDEPFSRGQSRKKKGGYITKASGTPKL